MESFLKNAIKNIFLILLFLFIGIVTEFDWRFWSLFLFYILRPFIDAAAYSLNSLTENRRQNRRQNRPPQ